MKAFSTLALFMLLVAAGAHAANIDMDDPRRSLGREGDVRIDAQLVRDTVTPGTPIGITYQIQNFSSRPVAVASKIADASYDEDTRTITLSVGAEIPPDGNMPHLVVIEPGEKKVLQAGAAPRLRPAESRSALAPVPRYVQVRVAILRDLAPFAAMIAQQDGRARQSLPDELFDQWLTSNDTIYLNAVPVHYKPAGPTEVERRSPRF